MIGIQKILNRLVQEEIVAPLHVSENDVDILAATRKRMYGDLTDQDIFAGEILRLLFACNPWGLSTNNICGMIQVNHSIVCLAANGCGWRSHVHNAQQGLKKNHEIFLQGGKWFLTRSGRDTAGNMKKVEDAGLEKVSNRDMLLMLRILSNELERRILAKANLEQDRLLFAASERALSSASL